MAARVPVGALVAVIVLVQSSRVVWGAPCVQACKDEIQACVGAECQGLTKKARRHCKRTCSKSIVRDCYSDLSVCGATIARPARPTSGGSSPGSGGW